MKAWTTFKLPKTCGRCGEVQPIGTRVQTIQCVGIKRILIRCETCAMKIADIAKAELEA